MSCCGTKRTALESAATKPATPAVRPGAMAAGPARRGPDFEYVGGSVLTVVGQGSGLQYRFVGHGARHSVDPRDRVSLAAVPALREVKR